MSSSMLTAVVAFILLATPPATLPGFHRSAWFDEQVREEWLADGVRVVVNAPAKYDPARPTRLVIYATPNGNTIEQTLGSTTPAGTDWHFDIQHVAAQVRRLREVSPDDNIVVACCEADGLSWPAWRKRFADSGTTSPTISREDHRVRRVVETVRSWMPGQKVRITLAGHSGGGSFLFGFLDSVDEVPSDIESFAFLDANYSYSDDAKHGDKLLAWLGGNNARRLTVIAYDDRNIMLDGKIQPATGIPSRPSDAAGGSELLQKLASLSPADREEMITREILRGNIPDFLRRFQSVTFPGEQAPASQHAKSNISTATPSAVHSIKIEVMPDYLAVGSDDDFVRVPMTPMAAQRIVDAFGCALPTQKIVDQIYKAASVKLAPMPLTEAREATETILHHHTIIEKQRTGRKLGELVAGTKKDVVVTNRLKEKPNRVAIYGWHKLDGAPIQPLTIVHHDTYVDYSHGIRLVRRTVIVNDQPRDIRHVLHAAELCPLLSDEGPLNRPSY